jgi:hypothetical protein
VLCSEQMAEDHVAAAVVGHSLQEEGDDCWGGPMWAEKSGRWTFVGCTG